MKKGLFALSPLMVFIAFYLVTSIVAGDFYKIPITVAFMVSSIYAIAAFRGKPLKQRIDLFSRGAATEQMMLMIWIFVLAGAFAHAAKAMGCIDATVNLTLSLLPPQMILAGMFLAACFVSISIGTSVGTIAALVPIAAGVANETNTDLSLMTAIIVGGSFFGDNLSFISDTTIMATQTQGCRLSDKFRVNSFIVFPVALLVFVCYLFMGSNVSAPPQVAQVEWVKVIPYLIVLITAIFGMNVMAVLTLGILLTGLIGLLTGSIDLYGWFGSMGEGIISMGELIIVTMMAGGMLELIRQQGGIDFIIRLLTRRVNNKRGPRQQQTGGRAEHRRTGVARQCMHSQQYGGHPDRRRHLQTHRRPFRGGQSKMCLDSRHVLVYHSGHATLWCPDSHRCWTGLAESGEYHPLPLLSVRIRPRSPAVNPAPLPSPLLLNRKSVNRK